MDNRFQEQMVSVVLGALISFLPSVALMRFQGAEQQRQLLFDRRLGALKDFSIAISSNGPLFAKQDELDGFEIQMSASPEPELDLPKLVQLFNEHELLQDEYVANLHAESLVMSSVFYGVRFPVLSYSELSPPGIPPKGASIREIRSTIRADLPKLREGEREQRNALISFVTEYEKTLDGIGAKMSP